MNTGEVHKHTNEHCDVSGGTSKSANHRALRNKMTDGKKWWKNPRCRKVHPRELELLSGFCQLHFFSGPLKTQVFR